VFLIRWLRRLLVVAAIVSVAAVVTCRLVDPPVTPLVFIRAAQARIFRTRRVSSALSSRRGGTFTFGPRRVRPPRAT